MTNPTDPPLTTANDHFARAQRLVARAQELDRLEVVYAHHGRGADRSVACTAMLYRRHALRHFVIGIIVHRREIRCQ